MFYFEHRGTETQSSSPLIVFQLKVSTDFYEEGYACAGDFFVSRVLHLIPLSRNMNFILIDYSLLNNIIFCIFVSSK